jgi:hypothetical protein
MVTIDSIKSVALGFLSKIAKIHVSFKPKRRRSALDRIKSRMRYKRNRSKIKIWRKRYNQRMKMMHQARKLLKRKKPSWMHAMSAHFKKPKIHKPKSLKHFFHKLNGTHHSSFHSSRPHAYKPKKFKIYTPKFRIHKPRAIRPNL